MVISGLAVFFMRADIAHFGFQDFNGTVKLDCDAATFSLFSHGSYKFREVLKHGSQGFQ